MQEYVLGLMFDQARRDVVLVNKKRPAWQAGKFNAPGGKVEPGEFPFDAMIREFKEETGLYHGEWTPFVRLTCPGVYALNVYVAFVEDVRQKVKTMTDEPVVIWPVTHLGYVHHVPNLDWLVPMALDPGVAKGRFIEIEDLGGQ